MADAVDPATTTTIDHIMAEMELINRCMDHHEACIKSIAAKLGLPPLMVVLRPVEVAASLVVEPLPDG
jgi:hypothetical protein